LARYYYCYALKLNPNNVRALYGILLVTSNLKSAQKTKEFNENTKLAQWASERLSNKYKVSLFLFKLKFKQIILFYLIF
jgi:hypothetical protein